MRRLPRLALSAAAFAASAAACDLPSLPDRRVVAIRNVCPGDGACDGGACLKGVCYATETRIRDIELSLAPADARGNATRITLQLGETGGIQRYDLLASPPVELHVTARFDKSSASPTGCQWTTSAGGSVGLRAAVLPSSNTHGLPTRTAFATGTPQPVGAEPPEYWHLATLVSPGAYDIYLSAIDDAECPIPPLLLRRAQLDNERFDLKVGLESPRPLSGTVKIPPGLVLDGFRAEVVDGATGLLISTVGVVASSDVAGEARFGVARNQRLVPIEYFPPILPAGEPPKSPVLRFVPPVGSAKPSPTLLWEVAVIDLDNSGVVALDLRDLATKTVTLEARVERGDDPVGAPAEVFLRSRKGAIVGAATGVPAFFATSLQTSPDGVFSLDLPAGVYDVTAVPVRDPSRTLARQTFELAPSPTVQRGRILELPARPSIHARIAGRADAALAGVVVDASPISQDLPTAVLETARRDSFLSPSIQSGRTDAEGMTVLRTDATVVTLTARPEGATGFPWAILPRVSPSDSVVELRPSYPVGLVGTVQNAAGPLPYASIRAFARIPTPSGTGELIPIGEATADARGVYELLLPSRFAP